MVLSAQGILKSSLNFLFHFNSVYISGLSSWNMVVPFPKEESLKQMEWASKSGHSQAKSEVSQKRK